MRNTGVFEEFGEVDADGAGIHSVRDRRGHHDSDHEAEERPRRLGLGVADHEQGGLDTFAADRKERQR
jgi:hypothetical protein